MCHPRQARDNSSQRHAVSPPTPEGVGALRFEHWQVVGIATQVGSYVPCATS